MYEVPKEWAEMAREEQEAWAAAVLKQRWADMGGVGTATRDTPPAQ